MGATSPTVGSSAGFIVGDVLLGQLRRGIVDEDVSDQQNATDLSSQCVELNGLLHGIGERFFDQHMLAGPKRR